MNTTILLKKPTVSKYPLQIWCTFKGALFNKKKNTIKEEKAKSMIPNIIITYLVIVNSSMNKNLGSYNLAFTKASLSS